MRWKIILYLYFNLFILNLWIYISNKIFGNTINNLQKTLNIILIWIISAGWLFIINNFMGIISTDNIFYKNNIYILTLFLLPILHYFLLGIRINYIYKSLINFTIAICIIILIKMTNMLDNILYYYLLVWFTEEFIKYNLSNNIYICNWKLKSDILLFGFMSGIGFWFIENIIYMYNFMAWYSNGSFIVFLVGRGLFWFLIHVVFSSILCYGMYIFYQKKSDYITNIYNRYLIYGLYFLISYILSSGLHAIYNIYISKYFIFTWLWILIFGYLLISYLFFLSDRRYYEQNSN